MHRTTRVARYAEDAAKMGGAPPIPPTYNMTELVAAFPFDDWGGKGAPDSPLAVPNQRFILRKSHPARLHSSPVSKVMGLSPPHPHSVLGHNPPPSLAPLVRL